MAEVPLPGGNTTGAVLIDGVIHKRARRQAGVIRRSAAAGDPASVALLPIAGLLESSAVDVEALPRVFWVR